jgi:phosphatidylglycerophosphate synthase
VWLAHALTLSRIPLAIALWAVWGEPGPAAALVLLAALTDTLDGRVARWAKRRGSRGPDIGGWLDPAADKLFVVIVLAAIWVHTRQLAVIALIGARELMLVPLIAVYVARRVPHRPLRADGLGKLATVAQFLALCVIAVVPAAALPAAAVPGVLGLVAASHYVALAVRDARAIPAAGLGAAVILHGDEASARSPDRAPRDRRAGGREGPDDR